MEKAEDGMLLPAPSVNAAAALVNDAYSPTVVRLGLITQDVVAVTVVLPGLVALPGVRLNVTELPERLTVSDSGKVAVSVMGRAPEVEPPGPIPTPATGPVPIACT